MNDEKIFEKVQSEIVELLKEKHKRYGSKNLLDYGLFGLIVRISDKISRIENQLTVEDEKLQKEIVKDQLMDIAGYSINGLRILDHEEISFSEFKFGKRFQSSELVKSFQNKKG